MSEKELCGNEIWRDEMVQKELKGRFYTQMLAMIVYLITSLILSGYIWAMRK